MTFRRPDIGVSAIFLGFLLMAVGVVISTQSSDHQSFRESLPQSTEIVVLNRSTVHFVCHGSVGLYEYKHRIDVVPDHEACQ